MVFRNEGSGGGSGSSPRPKPQRIAPQTTIQRAPQRFVSAPQTTIRKAPARVSRPQPVHHSPAPQPVRQSAPAPARPAFKPNSSGQLSGNNQRNNKPQSAPQTKQGKIQGAGSKTPQTKPAAPKPAVPGIDKYLSSDTTYQSGLSELMKNLQQFQTGNAQSQNDVKSAFQTALERMGQEREQSLKSLQEDFASRGLLNSGLYADANSDYDTQYQQRLGDLTKDEQGQLSSLSTDATNFQGLNQSQQAALKAAAIQRRAEKYGIKG